jgi:cytochrome c556
MRFIMRALFAFVPAAMLSILLSAPFAHADERTMVEMPAPMQEHMLGNMRDHLYALNEILDALAQGNTAEASAVAEQRLGLSSLDDHGAAHLAGFMPPEMQAAGTELHKAASRFIQAAENAEMEHTFEAQQKVFGALQGITSACNTCHTSFRIR